MLNLQERRYHLPRQLLGGQQQRICRAMEDMRKEAVDEERLKTLRNLMKNLGLTAEQALVAMGVSELDKGILIKKFVDKLCLVKAEVKP